MTDQQIVREFQDGFTIKVSIKRGTGTRDEDRLSYRVAGETMEKAEERAEQAITQLEELAERTRAIQTVEGSDDE